VGFDPHRSRLALLRDERSFRLLFLATVGSGLGSMLAVIALVVDVFDRTGSGKWVAALLIADFLPMIVIGLLLGPLVDRFSRRRLMVVSDLVRCVAFLALMVAPGPVTIVILAGVVGFATGFFRPAVYAGLPNLVPSRDLAQANGIVQAADNLTWLVGPVLGGALLAVAGPSLPYGINAVTFVVSAALLLRIPARELAAGTQASDGHWRDLAAGFRVVRNSRALLTVLIAWTIATMAMGGVNVGQVPFAKVAFGAGDFELGVLMGGSGLGLVLGSVTAAAWLDRLPFSRVYGGALFLMASGATLAAVSPTVWAAAGLFVVMGFGNGLAVVCNPLLVQRGAPDRFRGRAFTVIMSANFAAIGLGMITAGAFADAVGARWVIGAAGTIFLVAAVTGGLLARRVDLDETVDEVAAPDRHPGSAPQAVPTPD
jgi:MFS family permease